MPKPVDPDVKIPAAVVAAGARAEELHKQVYSPESPPADQPADPPADPTPAQQDPAPVPPPANVTQEGNDDPNGETWKHKYQSVHGRLKRQEKTIQEQGDTIANLQAVIATMQQPVPSATVPAEQQATSLLTPEEIEQFGPDFLNVVSKKAKEIAAAETVALRNELADVKAKLAGVGSAVVKSAREKMFERLTAEVPNWQELNTDDKFIAWLGLPDVFSGAIRHDLLTKAYEQNDAPRVLAFFKGFLAEEAATAPALAAQPDPTTTQVEKVPLAALAAPGRAKTAAPTPPAEKPIINRAQISQFYVDKAAGRYRGREDEALRMEQEIFAAQREGRIR